MEKKEENMVCVFVERALSLFCNLLRHHTAVSFLSWGTHSVVNVVESSFVCALVLWAFMYSSFTVN